MQSSLMSMLPLVLMFVVLYFVMIRPQMKKSKRAIKYGLLEVLGLQLIKLSLYGMLVTTLRFVAHYEDVT